MRNNDKKNKNNVIYETKILDNSITKIGALLLLGFGEAGTSLLSDMMSRDGDIDTMEVGKKTIGIFGFWDIRQFTDTTEVLEENVMMFVNEIAQMVHGETHEYLGDPNKNIGDAFLLVWKFPQSEIYTGLNGDLCFSKDSYLINNYAESALIAILKIIYKMSRDQRIVAYSENTKLTAKMPDYKVKMGFGLHWGWCIEGAIGSSYKIDATYLSHHVNYASSLEEKTKMYGVLLAISHQFYEICSIKSKKYFRQIDWYQPKGSKDINKVYTVDVETGLIVPDKNAIVLTGKQHYQEKINRRLDNLVQTKDPNFKMAIRLRQDPELIALLKNVPKKILVYYKKMFQHYLKGEWRKWKSGLNKIIKRKKDGPSLFLLEVMKEYNFKAPKNWRGVREITS